jgi:hypothetical protein
MANENSGESWSAADEKELAKLAKGNASTRLTAMSIGPPNQSP